MRALVQRVKRCTVSIEGTPHSSIGKGILIFLGVKNGDTESDGEYLAGRCAQLRVFEDQTGKMNYSVKDVKGDIMVVSQFTLYGDTRQGNRPSYTDAAPPQIAELLYNQFIAHLNRCLSGQQVCSGVFRAMMDVELTNDGPVTLLLESKKQTV